MASRNADAGSRERDRSALFPWLVGAAAVGAAVGLGSLGLAYFSTHPIRLRVRRTPAELGLAFERLSFASHDGVRLTGWWIPSPGATAGIAVCHGHPFNRSWMLEWVRLLHPAGFNLLLFDFRAHGESEGTICTLGCEEAQDVLAAVDTMRARPEMAGLPVGVFGLSMGGVAALLAAARDPGIRAVATHGAFATLERAIARRCLVMAGPLAPAVRPCATWWGGRWLPASPREIAPVEAIGRIAPRPVLLLHGSRDLIIDPRDAELLERASGGCAERVPLPHSWHAGVHAADRSLYERRLVGFFRKWLGVGS